jgi:hypothetical protein
MNAHMQWGQTTTEAVFELQTQAVRPGFNAWKHPPATTLLHTHLADPMSPKCAARRWVAPPRTAGTWGNIARAGSVRFCRGICGDKK